MPFYIVHENAHWYQHLETLLVLKSEQQTPWTYLFQDGKWLLSFEERNLELTEERMKLIASGEEGN
jgi:hypothetical protein